MASSFSFVALSTAATSFILFGLGLGCSGSKAEPNNPPPPAATNHLCDGYRPLCERQVECGVAVINQETTVANCIAATDCGAVSDDELDDYGVAVIPSQITVCKAALAELSCGQVASLRGGLPEKLSACGDFVRGKKEEGDTCDRIGLDECATGLTCVFDEQCPGRCEAETTVTCSVTSCAVNEYCSYSVGRCLPRGAPDETCEYNLPEDYGRVTCQDGLHCVGDVGEEATCQTRIAAGASCDECLDPGCCVAGTYCATDNVGAATCTARVGVGDECNFAAMCGEELFCDFASGRCATRKAVGAACRVGAEGGCVLGAVCVGSGEDGTCVPNVEDNTIPVTTAIADGTSCEGTDYCRLGAACVGADGRLVVDAIDSGTCQKKLGAPGDACSPLNDPLACAVGFCDFVTGQCPTLLKVDDACAPSGLNMGCPFALCLNGKCAGLHELVCDSVR